MPQIRPIHDIACVFAFLTRIPIPVTFDPARPLARAAWAFPLVGVVVGGIGGAMCLLGAWIGLPPMIAALLALGAMAVVTGALHEDGLADVVDGFGGGRDRESILRIMRDSRIGTFGVLALIVAVGCRAGSVAESTAPLKALVLGSVLGRAVIPAVMAGLPAASKTGLGASSGKPSIAGILIALGLGALCTGLLLPPVAVATVLGVAAIAACAVALIALRTIGGMTGDVLGATEQVVETAVLVTLLAV